MRWSAFFILAYLLIGVQIGISHAGSATAAHPAIVLLGAVFIALNAPRKVALLACFILGLIQDLMTLQPLGVSAVEYALVALLVVNAQDVVYRNHPLTHAFLGLVCGLLGAVTLLMHAWIYGLLRRKLNEAGLPVGRELLGVLYTALAAPVVLGILQRMTRYFGFRTVRAASRTRVIRSAGPRWS